MFFQLEVARKCGADVVLNPRKCDVVKEVLDLTEQYGCDVYIDATGHPQSVKQGWDVGTTVRVLCCDDQAQKDIFEGIAVGSLAGMNGL